MDEGFENNLARFSSQFLMMSSPIASINFVPAGSARRGILRALIRLDRWSVRFPLAAFALAPAILAFAVGSYFANLLSLRNTSPIRTSAGYSSLCFVLRPTKPHPLDVAEQRISGYWTRRNRQHRHAPVPAATPVSPL
jgi:hypothetical protein